MTVNRFITTLLCALPLLGAAACTEETSPPPQPIAKQDGPASASPTTKSPLGTIAEAVPIDDSVRVIAELSGTAADGKWQSVAAITPDGRMVLDVMEPATSEELSGDILRLANPRKPAQSDMIPVHPSSSPTQAYGVQATDSDIVWMTTTSARLESWPWKLWAYNRDSGRVEQLARSAKVNGQDPPQVPGFTGPTAAGESVYWAEYHGEGKQLRVDIMDCQIRDCKPRIVARDAMLPAATRDSLYFVHVSGASGRSQVEIRKRAEATGKTTTVSTLGSGTKAIPSGLAASEAVVAWTHRLDNRGAITIRDLRSRKQSVIVSRVGGTFGFPIATDRFVAWAEASGSSPDQVGGYLYDLRGGTLYELGNRSGFYSITGAADTVTWQELRSGHARPKTVIARLP